MTEYPLYVQVAEALGWTDLECVGGLLSMDASSWVGLPPGRAYVIGEKHNGRSRVPRYDLKWEHAGPLLHNLDAAISVEWPSDEGYGRDGECIEPDPAQIAKLFVYVAKKGGLLA